VAAKLIDANLGSTRASDCDFRGAELNSARLNLANLRQNTFCGATMARCDFRESDLSSADFSGAVLLNSIFREANIMATDFRGSVLEGARGLTGRQLSQSLTSFNTVLPSGTRGPFIQGKNSEVPVNR
jgi:uncharacterized protein YjbI with pentapeptide repeats